MFIKLKLEVLSPFTYRSFLTLGKMPKDELHEIFSREDLERVNEEFHENGTVSYETKKVSFLRRDDIPRWFYKVDDLRLF